MTYKLFDTFLEDGFYVTQNYMNNPSYYAQFGLKGHEGVDFGHKNKEVIVRSPISGTAFVSTNKNYGEYCVIEDYKQQCGVYICHMQKIKVISGQEIKVGQQIGEMDDTGNSNGEHVHFNFLILENGSNKYRSKQFNYGYLDPMYPRDTGKTVKLPGVEEYVIEWGKGVNTSDTTLQDKITVLERDLAEQRQQVSNYVEQVSGWTKKYDECNTQRIEAGASSDGFRKQYNEYLAKVAGKLGTRQEEVETLSAIDTLITKEDKLTDLLEERATEATLKAKEYKETVEALVVEIASLKTQLTTLETKIANLPNHTDIIIKKQSIIDIIKKIFGVK